DPGLVGSLMQKYGPEHIVLALDVNISRETGKAMVAVHGWQEESALSLEQVIEEYKKYGLVHVLCTDISKDGTMQGSNVSLYRRVCGEFPSIKFQASGGIGSLKDIESLKGSGVSGIILGKSLLDGKFTVKEAIECWQKE
nr:1-(5-phosphoribosyl)-5-((5-phosphoribosylamino)methylideneamino)imidazole-4-carboxamide isomerase [Succinivibrionaceae bacterium]